METGEGNTVDGHYEQPTRNQRGFVMMKKKHTRHGGVLEKARNTFTFALFVSRFLNIG